MTDADLRVARIGHAEAVRQLTGTGRASVTPTSFDVRAVLVEFGIDIRRTEIVAWCAAAGLPLADDEFPDEITRKLPTQSR